MTKIDLHHLSINSRFVAICIAIALCFLWFALPPAICYGMEGGFIELVVPLENGRFYTLRSYLEESNRKLGTGYPLDKIVDRKIEVRDLEKAILLLASDVGLFHAQFEPDRLVLSIPDPQDDSSRRLVRDRLSRILRLPINEWPAHLGLHLPKDFDSSKRTILLTHGLEGGVASLRPMQLAFEHSGIQVAMFDFPNDGPIAWSGEHLSKCLSELAERFPPIRLAIVAHSMGGLVTRSALETPGKAPGCVTDIFLLGTPNQGSRLSLAQPWLELVLEVLPRPHHMLDAMTDGLGEAASDMQPGSRFLNALNARDRVPGARYHLIMGRKSFVSDDQRTSIAKELNRLFERRSVAAETRRAVLDLLHAEELQDGLGDGAVTLRSARLAGVRDEKVFDLNHLQLLVPPQPASEEGDVVHWILSKLGWERVKK